MKILFPLHNNGFDSLQEDEKKETEKSGDEIICAILYLENSDKARFAELKKRVENKYVLNKVEYRRMVTAVQILLLKYQPNYNSKIYYQSDRVSNQLMFAQCGKIGHEEGNRKEKKQRPRRNLDHITCNDCGEKDHYAGNNDCPTQARIKEDAEAFRKTKQEKSFNKIPGGGYQKALVKVKDALCSTMMGPPTKEWGKLPSPGSLFLLFSVAFLVPNFTALQGSVCRTS